jgi:hypothetical protein
MKRLELDIQSGTFEVHGGILDSVKEVLTHDVFVLN